jgi:hypothetical protein
MISEPLGICEECRHPLAAHGPEGCKVISWKTGTNCTCSIEGLSTGNGDGKSTAHKDGGEKGEKGHG